MHRGAELNLCTAIKGFNVKGRLEWAHQQIHTLLTGFWSLFGLRKAEKRKCGQTQTSFVLNLLQSGVQCSTDCIESVRLTECPAGLLHKWTWVVSLSAVGAFWHILALFRACTSTKKQFVFFLMQRQRIRPDVKRVTRNAMNADF
jgi:hypothetical protein